MGEATAAGVSRRRNPQEGLNRDSDLKLVENFVAEMPLFPCLLQKGSREKKIMEIMRECGIRDVTNISGALKTGWPPDCR